MLIIHIMISKFSIFLKLKEYFRRILNIVLASLDMLLSQQAKEHFSLEVKVILDMLLRLLATIAQDGADWMICNQLELVIVQSSMLTRC